MDNDDIADIATVYSDLMEPINESSAMRLKDLCDTYPKERIIAALEAAARRGIHSWRYIETILSSAEKRTGPGKYTQGKYGANVHSSADDILRAWEARKQRSSSEHL